MTKKLISVFLAVAMLLSLASCGDRDNESSDESNNSGAHTSQTSSADNSSEKEKTLPKLKITGNLTDMWDKSDVRDISIVYEEDGKNFGGFATIKVQGNSSLRYAKKNYTIKFFKDQYHEQKNKVDLGWGAQNEYCLKANWIDKTHSRNIVSAELASEVQKKYGLFMDAPHNGTIDGYPIEIYNNGAFLGIYTLNIPKDEWLFNMDKDNPNHIVFCGESWEPACVFEAAPDFSTWELEVGEENAETLNKLKRLFNFVMNSSDAEFKRDFKKYMNLDAALNYYILAEFMYLPDNQGKNMILATYDGEIWYPSLYDLDTSWGVDWKGESILDYINSPMSWERNKLFRRLKENFSQEIYDRYKELRRDLLTEEHVMELFESFKASIPETSFKREELKWGKEIPGYAITQIRSYLQIRIPKLDKAYEKLNTKATT